MIDFDSQCRPIFRRISEADLLKGVCWRENYSTLILKHTSCTWIPEFQIISIHIWEVEPTTIIIVDTFQWNYSSQVLKPNIQANPPLPMAEIFSAPVCIQLTRLKESPRCEVFGTKISKPTSDIPLNPVWSIGDLYNLFITIPIQLGIRIPYIHWTTKVLVTAHVQRNKLTWIQIVGTYWNIWSVWKKVRETWLTIDIWLLWSIFDFKGSFQKARGRLTTRYVKTMTLSM